MFLVVCISDCVSAFYVCACMGVRTCVHEYIMLCHTVDWATGMASGMEETECWCIGGRDMLCGERFASLVVI